MLVFLTNALAGTPVISWEDVLRRYNQQSFSAVGNRFVLSYAGYERFESSKTTTVGMHEVTEFNPSFQVFLKELCTARMGDAYTIGWTRSRSDLDALVEMRVHCTASGDLRGYDLYDGGGVSHIYGCFETFYGKDHRH